MARADYLPLALNVVCPFLSSSSGGGGLAGHLVVGKKELTCFQMQPYVLPCSLYITHNKGHLVHKCTSVSKKASLYTVSYCIQLYTQFASPRYESTYCVPYLSFGWQQPPTS